MRVRTSEHKRLGTVVGLDDDGFVVEVGHLRHRRIHVHFGEIVTFQDDTVVIATHRRELTTATKDHSFSP